MSPSTFSLLVCCPLTSLTLRYLEISDNFGWKSVKIMSCSCVGYNPKPKDSLSILLSHKVFLVKPTRMMYAKDIHDHVDGRR